jgi:hypothetical protein
MIDNLPAIMQTLNGSERIPGDFGFDPLGLARDPDQFARRQVLPVCLALSVTCETPVILLVVVVTRRP